MATQFINKTTVGAFIDKSGNLAKEKVTEFVCTFNNTPDLYYILFFILFFLLFLLLIIYKDFLINLFRRVQAKKGYVKIQLILPNRRIKNIFKSVDRHNKIDFKGKTYPLEKMNDYIIGYDKNNMPVFMYHHQFIFPLKISQKEITEDIKRSYEESTGEILTDKKLPSLMLKIDTSILHTVYSRKLLQDLYAVSTMDNKKYILIMIVIGVIALIVAYWTGLLDKLLELAGV